MFFNYLKVKCKHFRVINCVLLWVAYQVTLRFEGEMKAVTSRFITCLSVVPKLEIFARDIHSGSVFAYIPQHFMLVLQK
jgi:hypothetical protein